MNEASVSENDRSSQDTDGIRTTERHRPSPAHQQRRRKRKRTLSDAHIPQEIGLMRNENEYGPSRFVGSASGIHFIRTVYTTLARKVASQKHNNQVPKDDLVPGEDDQLYNNDKSHADAQHLWRVPEISLDIGGASDPDRPPFDQLVDCTRSFFEIWHPAFPFLHAPAVLEVFENISNVGIGRISQPEAIIVRSIVSISLADTRQRGSRVQPVPASLVFKSINDVLSSVQVALCRPTSLRVTQAAVCVQLFLISMLRFNSASRLGGLIVRMAFHLGLHRCPTRFPTFTSVEAQIRRRLFWSIYCLERLLCQSLGLPLDIRDDDIDVCYPGHELHTSHSSQSAHETNPHDGDRLRLLTYLAKHARITGLILELRNKSVFHRQDTSDRATYVHAELAKWVNEIHDAIEPDFGDDNTIFESTIAGPSDREELLQPTHRLLLLIMKQESVISLNRPLMTSSISRPEHVAALQNCISSSRTIISTLKRFGTKQVPMVWPSFTWAIWMSCFVLMYAASESHFPVPSALRYADQSIDVLKHLSLRESSWPDFCAVAIRQLVPAVSQKPDSRSFGDNHDPSVQRPTASRPKSSQQIQGLRHANPSYFPQVSRKTRPSELSVSIQDRQPSTHSNFHGDGPSVQERPVSDIQPQNGQVSAATLVDYGGSNRQSNVSYSWSRADMQPGSQEECNRQSAYAPSTNDSLHQGSNLASVTRITPGSGPNTTLPLPQDAIPSLRSYSNLFPLMDSTHIMADGSRGSLFSYDQMFNDPFSAMDLPYLAAGQLDPVMDPIPVNWD